jgi:hypothetical protein
MAGEGGGVNTSSHVSSFKNTNPTGSGSHLCNLFNLNYLLIVPVFRYGHIGG